MKTVNEWISILRGTTGWIPLSPADCDQLADTLEALMMDKQEGAAHE